MSYDTQGLDLTLEASADLSTGQFRAVTVVAAGAELVAAADAAIVGVLQNNPDAAGKAASIQTHGASKAVAGGVIARGDELSTDATGALVAGGGNTVAIALQAASAADSIIAVLLK